MRYSVGNNFISSYIPSKTQQRSRGRHSSGESHGEPDQSSSSHSKKAMALILEKGGDEGGGGTEVDNKEETKSNKVSSLNSGGIVLPGTAPGLAKMPGHKGK